MPKFDTSFNFGANATGKSGSRSRKGKSSKKKTSKGKGAKSSRSWHKKGGGS